MIIHLLVSALMGFELLVVLLLVDDLLRGAVVAVGRRVGAHDGRPREDGHLDEARMAVRLGRLQLLDARNLAGQVRLVTGRSVIVAIRRRAGRRPDQVRLDGLLLVRRGRAQWRHDVGQAVAQVMQQAVGDLNVLVVHLLMIAIAGAARLLVLVLVRRQGFVRIVSRRHLYRK